MSTKWLDAIQEKIASCWECQSASLRFGFEYVKPGSKDDCWEIWAYPAVQEIVGGEADGETVWSCFNFDILQFLTDFEPVAISISTHVDVDPSELTFEGKFLKKEVFVHICLEPPDDAEATEIIDVRGTRGLRIRDKE